MKKSPYKVIKSKYVSEKAHTLQTLKSIEGNRSISRCNQAKYTFVVDMGATKEEIARAVEEIYSEDNLKVSKVNVIVVKPKKKGRSRKGKAGFKSGFKKAVVTLQPGDEIKE